MYAAAQESCAWYKVDWFPVLDFEELHHVVMYASLNLHLLTRVELCFSVAVWISCLLRMNLALCHDNNESAPSSRMTRKRTRLQSVHMWGRQGQSCIRVVRTDIWLGWYPVQTVLSRPLTWQQLWTEISFPGAVPKGARQGEHNKKPSLCHDYDGATCSKFHFRVSVAKASHATISPKRQSLSNLVGQRCRYSVGGALGDSECNLPYSIQTSS